MSDTSTMAGIGERMPGAAPPAIGVSTNRLARAPKPAPAAEPPTQKLPPNLQQLLDWAASDNIAADLDPQRLDAIGQRVTREFTIDENSRSEWKDRAVEAMDLAMQKTKPKQFPWPGAANVIYPLMTTASIEFGARAYPAIVASKDVVRGVVSGDDSGLGQMGPDGQVVWTVPPGAKQERADRVGEHMSWQLLDEMPEWEPDTDRLLHQLPIVGCVFRKTYSDPSKGRNVSVMVSAIKLVVNYHAKSIDVAPRLTEELEFYPLEIEEKQRAGVFRELDYGIAPNADGDEDAPHQFLEQHRWLDLDKDGYPEPYVVTVHKETSQVARIVARYDADAIKLRNDRMPDRMISLGDLMMAPAMGIQLPPEVFDDTDIAKIEPVQFYTQYDFLPNPEEGVYGVGFGHLLRPLNESVNTVLNQLIDAGTLANSGGGFIGKQLSMATGAVRFQLGEYKMVNVTGGTIRDNVFPIPFPGASPVLFSLLGAMLDAGKDIASVKDILPDDKHSRDIPATTMMAMIQEGMRVFTAIYKRVHRSFKAELAKLYRLNRVYMPEEGAKFRRGDAMFKVTPADYAPDMAVEPMSDPTMVTDMQRLARVQFLLGFKDDPRCNGVEIIRRAFESALIERVDDVLSKQQPTNPALVAKAMEIQIKAEREKAAEIRDMAQAILFLAQSDQVVGEAHIQFLEGQLGILERDLGAMVGGRPGQQGSGADGAGDQGSGSPGVAPSPGQQGPAPIPGGLPADAGAGNAGPVAGAAA